MSTFSLGDIVSKALNYYDNEHGVRVVSELDPKGNAVRGGHRWTAMEDSHLADAPHGPETRDIGWRVIMPA
jgi:hypothetical protein